MKTTTLKKDFRLIFIAGFFLLAASVYAAIGLPWGPDEKRENGFLVMSGTSKDINVYSECRKVTAPSGKNVYVPTGTATEWSAFKTGAINVGATLGPCGGVVNGVCGTSPAVCTSGTVIGDNGNTTPGQNRLWTCQGSGGGTNSPQCSYTNPVASCVPNGSYTYGSCSEACGNFGVREQYDSCGDLVTNSDPCNRFSCPSSCSYVDWHETTAPTCSAQGIEIRTLTDCTSEDRPIPQLSGSSCPTGIWTKGSCIPKSGQTCGAGNGTQSYTCAGGNGYCSGSQPANEDCDLTACAPLPPDTTDEPTCLPCGGDIFYTSPSTRSIQCGQAGEPVFNIVTYDQSWNGARWVEVPGTYRETTNRTRGELCAGNNSLN